MNVYGPLIIGGIVGWIIGILVILLWWEIRWRRQFSESLIYGLFEEYIKPHLPGQQ